MSFLLGPKQRRNVYFFKDDLVWSFMNNGPGSPSILTVSDAIFLETVSLTPSVSHPFFALLLLAVVSVNFNYSVAFNFWYFFGPGISFSAPLAALVFLLNKKGWFWLKETFFFYVLNGCLSGSLTLLFKCSHVRSVWYGLTTFSDLSPWVQFDFLC